ncbi:tRNA dihydrouridine synthase [Legionella tunisiensis]|uniref:tRNA dihydrouridine synthase n=1 Tax=Legionella tunisiensis TaxID=1034944 RepID=UPI00047460D9|nr:tRNA-dihydrouridine synthase family protein [Legionella tunisiensis]
MHSFLNSSFNIGSIHLANRLIQGPLAGFSCAPFRELFYQFTPPAYCTTEMISAHDVLHKHQLNSRYLYRSPLEKILSYQIAGNDPGTMAEAGSYLASMGANLIDINCGCPKTKIRKKGAGSALLNEPQQLLKIVYSVRKMINLPLTVKLRIQGNGHDADLAKAIEQAGADALIIHGRRWNDDYSVDCNFAQIAEIKRAVSIPVIANGDIHDKTSLTKALINSGCDAYMIARAGTGKPWLYQNLLDEVTIHPDPDMIKVLFMQHLHKLAKLENDYKAVLQSRALLRYYFKAQLSPTELQTFYNLEYLDDIERELKNCRSRSVLH